tara:strand:+ start:577 stop:1068 length:492 start_codon:yes stop_codon:yes gene_type:complete
MHIKLINKKLVFGKYKVKCAIGKRGILRRKKEGDNATPKGKFKIKSLYYRKDRVLNLKTRFKKNIIKKNMGWCDDTNSKFYNKLIKLPFNAKAEKLYLKRNIYDIVLTLDYNTNPIRKNKGSAIFIHIASKNYKPTKGCLAISKMNMRVLLKYINKKSEIIIY